MAKEHEICKECVGGGGVNNNNIYKKGTHGDSLQRLMEDEIESCSRSDSKHFQGSLNLESSLVF